MMIPPIFCSPSSMRWTMMRSCSGLTLMLVLRLYGWSREGLVPLCAGCRAPGVLASKNLTANYRRGVGSVNERVLRAGGSGESGRLLGAIEVTNLVRSVQAETLCELTGKSGPAERSGSSVPCLADSSGGRTRPGNSSRSVSRENNLSASEVPSQASVVVR